jgi:hypothetical protein
MFRNPETGAIDMVSLILTVVIPNVSQELYRGVCGSYYDGGACSRGKYGTFHARNYALSPQLIADKRSYQYRNCVPSSKVPCLHSRKTSWHWDCSFLQRYSSSVSLPVSSVRESNFTQPLG